MLKKIFLVLCVLFYAVGVVAATEVTLFDKSGTPVAYIDTDDEYTVYLWNGTPAAYLTSSSARNSLSLYGFNGKLLGWWVDGAIYDTGGTVSGFVKNCCPMHEPYTKYEPYKSYKRYKPYKRYREYEKFQPYLKRNWGKDLSLLLKSGCSN